MTRALDSGGKGNGQHYFVSDELGGREKAHRANKLKGSEVVSSPEEKLCSASPSSCPHSPSGR